MEEHLVEEQLTHSVIGAFYEVYNTLGHGFLESIYMKALEVELRARGHIVRREVPVLITYKGERLGNQRLDMIVDERLVVEGKASEKLDASAPKQVLAYLKGSKLQVGLLLFFGPTPGIVRLINTRKPWKEKLASGSRAEFSRAHPQKEKICPDLPVSD
jgi:GxxExxY protein